MDNNPKYLTAAEAAELLRVTPFWVTEECRRGNLRAAKVARSWRITKPDLDEYVASKVNRPEPSEVAS